MKLLLLIVGLGMAALIYPRYDLLVKENFFDEASTLAGSGYYTTVGCHKKANEIKARYYICSPKTLIGQLFSIDDESKNKAEDLGVDSGLPQK